MPEEYTSQEASRFEETRAMELAIIGMSGRFPGAANVDEFWKNLCDGVEAISFFSDEEVEAAGIDRQQFEHPHYVKAGGILDGIEDFDAGFFGIYPREAAIMDPQHRIFLEVAWQAMENAGYNPESYPGWVGVFAGSGMNSYLLYNLIPNLEIMESVNGYQLNLSNDKDFLPTRTSYKLNLRGPSINVQTACSTSLVAVHLACQSLLSYQCDMALAGGVTIRVPQKAGYLYQEGGITSPDGHCRAFDAKAAGTVGGNGAGVVVIKRLIDAVRDGDSIRAIIKGSAINNDGSLKVGYTAPSIDGQAEVISMAQGIANIDPSTITYIETHGTGTALGDPIEIAALTQVFRNSTEEKQFCAIGSVKTNVGHLDAAAGVTSLIKTTLALQNGLIPPSLHFTEPNPKIDFENSPFYVNTTLKTWERDEIPRRAGISSFGIGGTNVHMILEDVEAVAVELAQERMESVNHRPWKLIPISARSITALEKATDNLVEHLKKQPELNLEDVAYTLQVGRKSFPRRRIAVGTSVAEIAHAFEIRDPSSVFNSADREFDGKQRPQIVFMFSGQGAQYLNMARELYETEVFFREQVDICAELLLGIMGIDIRLVIFNDAALGSTFEPGEAASQETDLNPAVRQELDGAIQALLQTANTQPALFVIEYALAKLLMAWGIVPEALIGHSIGEYVAACLAGVFNLEDALSIVAKRGELMQSLPGGAMLSIPLSETEVQQYLGPGLSLAAVNAPALCVISGGYDKIDALSYRLANDGVEYRRLRTSHAFHSEMMDPILEEFREQFSRLELETPKIPIISNLSGTWLSESQATDPDYWVSHLRYTVRFSDGVDELLRDPAWTLIEVGPGQTLVSLAKSVLSSRAMALGRPIEERVILPTLRPARSQQSDQAFLVTALGRLWLAGIDVDWLAYHSLEKLHRLPLPTYPFERNRYWVEPDISLGQLLISGGRTGRQSASPGVRPYKIDGGDLPHLYDEALYRKRQSIGDWFYTPTWKRSSVLPGRIDRKGFNSNVGEKTANHNWLIVGDLPIPEPGEGKVNLADAISGRISTEFENEQPVTSMVRLGRHYERLSENQYQVNPENPDEYLRLFNELNQRGQLPGFIVLFARNLEVSTNSLSNAKMDPISVSQQINSFSNLLHLVQALIKVNPNNLTQICIVTTNTYEVIGDEALEPEHAALAALCKVITQEYPHLVCRQIDISPESNEHSLSSNGSVEQVTDWILSEITLQPKERFVAYRGRYRWTQIFETLDEEDILEVSKDRPLSLSLLRQNGVYMITGGLGRIGLALAEFLSSRMMADLVLVDRFKFPDPQEWEDWLSGRKSTPGEDVNQGIINRIQRLQALQANGSRVLVLQADVASFSDMQSVFQEITHQLGPVNGIIHAAGLVGEAAIKPLLEIDNQSFTAHYLPKVSGINVLNEIIQEHADRAGLASGLEPQTFSALDFVFLQSSLSTVLGGLGLGAYAAANAVMDGYSVCYNQQNGPAWICVHWDGWRFDDSTSSGFDRIGPAKTTLAELSMTPLEGIQVFEQALRFAGRGVRQMVISTADLDARLNKWITYVTYKGEALTQDQGPDQAGIRLTDARQGQSFPRPNLQTTYMAPRNELETQIVEAWQKILGISPIGIFDDFFELGGHSLLATQLVTRLRDTFKVDLPLRRLFEAPTAAGLVAMIEEGQAAAQNLAAGSTAGYTLVELTSVEPPKIQEENQIPRLKDRQALPLSFGQQRLWFIDQFEPGSPLYNNFAALRLNGSLDREALEYCLNKIVKRHESLRTTIQEVRGQPVQVIKDVESLGDSDVPMQFIDLQNSDGLDTPEQLQAKITQLAIEEARKPFNLSEGPLFRIALFRLKPDEHVIFLTMHHIVSDGWSVGVLVAEVGTFYSAYLRSRWSEDVDLDAILPELPIQYGDYASWQRQWLQGERLQAQLDYWKARLANSQNLEIFTDFPRPPVQTWHGANHWFELSTELSNALSEFSQREGSTLFMTLLAVLQVLLARYSGQEDISIGAPIANRTRVEAESLIGFLLNTLVMRTDLSGNPSFRELLLRVRETALGAYAHQDLPFEMLVEALQPARDMSRAPFFQVIFDLQVAPLQALKLPNLTVTPIPIDGGTAKFDLALSLEDSIQPGGNLHSADHKLKGYLNYNSDLFEPKTIARLLDHFRNLLESVLQYPDISISQLSMLSSQEIHQLSFGWNKTLAPLPAFTSPAPLIHEMVRQQVKLHPADPAVILAADDMGSLRTKRQTSLTYAELDAQSDQLARTLIRLGVQPETLVGLCMDRSIEMIIGILGVFKAGGAILPLDPSYPIQRLAFMLEDSGALAVLTQDALLRNKPELTGLLENQGRVVRYDGNSFIAVQGRLNELARPVNLAGPDNLAYVIYTSGSTGKPKGVMITHQAAADHCRDMAKHFQIDSSDHVLQFASLNFDAGLEQVFTSLISGAQLVLRDDDVWTAEEFQQKIDKYGLTVVNVPPAYWHPWVQYVFEKQGTKKPSNSQLDSQGESQLDGNLASSKLKLAIIGGDLMAFETLKLWWQTPLRHVRLLNAYGPTETTITAATYEAPTEPVARLAGSHYARIPIGKPHPNRTAYILDRNGNLLPDGVPGELHLGGAYLARGYLNHPELTSEKFIPDPFTPAGRLYKTGDLVRRLPDGTLDFLGRIDQQVKLRGFRIELGEIESTIAEYAKVEDVSVVIQTDKAGSEKRLIAYLVMSAQGSLDVGDLYDYLKERLPGYMVPAAFITLESLPLTPSGKVDRQALADLPLPEQGLPMRMKEVVGPRSPLEQEILTVWVDVLGISLKKNDPTITPLSQEPMEIGISIYDNFFELGGHSLLATQVISRLRETYQVDLPLRQLFENPTIAGIAEVITQSLVVEDDDPDLDALLAELEGLSEEQVQQMLAGGVQGANGAVGKEKE